MFSLLRSNNTHKAGATQGVGHFAACKVQYLDDSFASNVPLHTTGGPPAGTPYQPEPARLSVTKPRAPLVPAKKMPTGPTPPAGRPAASPLPLPGSKLLKAWRAARK